MSAHYNQKKAQRQFQYRENKKKTEDSENEQVTDGRNIRAEIQSQYRERKKLKMQQSVESSENIENNSISVTGCDEKSQQQLCDLTPNTRRLVKGKFKVPLQIKQQNNLNRDQLQFIKVHRDDAGPSHAITQSSTNRLKIFTYDYI